MSIDKLFREGHLKKIPPSIERADKSIATAERYLSEARKTLEIGVHELAIIAAYSAIFHAARAILFLDGVGERSHFAIFEYIREKHGDLGEELVNSFDLFRKLRHSVAYGLDTHVSQDDTEGIIGFAEDFISRVKKHVGSRKGEKP